MAITFLGITTICRAEVVLTRGVLPGVQVVLIVPQDGLNLQPGELVIDDETGGVLVLPDALPLQMSMRKVKLDGGYVWALEILDHRWRWDGPTVGGEWNKRLPDGSVDELTKKTPQELATLCLDALNESGYSVAGLPTNVYPYCDWRQHPSARLCLQEICDATACYVCGGEFAAVTIYAAGTGPDMPTVPGNTIIHSALSMVRPAPASYRVIGGPKRYCTKLKLDPFGFESDNSVTGIENLSYRPSAGWGSELPGDFGGLSAANQVLAKKGVWRVYEIAGQEDGSLDVPGSNVLVDAVAQYLPLLPAQVDSDSYTDDSKFPLPPKVTGTFYNYGDVPVDEAADTEWLGGFDLDLARGRVTFPVPVFKMGASQVPEAPTLKLLTSYHVRDAAGDEEGSLEHLDYIGAGSGYGGPLFIRRPELFDARQESTDYTHGTDEAILYIALFQAAYADNDLQDQTYAGIPAGSLSGLVAQIAVMGSYLGDEGFTTRICRLEELAPLSPSEIERKRKLITQRIAEERGL